VADDYLGGENYHLRLFYTILLVLPDCQHASADHAAFIHYLMEHRTKLEGNCTASRRVLPKL
jgi:hypothetical protein